MLIRARERVLEHSGNGGEISLFGQEVNVSTWAIARVNLLLNGVQDSTVLQGVLLPILHTRLLMEC